MKDDYAIVLDFLSRGYASQIRAHPVAQVIGEKFFNLLEVVPHDNITLKTGDKVYIGQGKRDQIKTIVGKITTEKLTGNAQSELEHRVKEIVHNDEKRFVDFYNQATSLTPKARSTGGKSLTQGRGKNSRILPTSRQEFPCFPILKSSSSRGS